MGGHDVTVIARPGSVRLQQLERDGAIIDLDGEQSNVRVASALDEQIPYDLIIVTVKTFQVDELLPALERSRAKCIQFMLNTFDPERLLDAIGVERCSFGMPFVQAALDGNGRLKATIGAAGQKTIMGLQRAVDVFNAAGLPSVFGRDMPLWLRCHVPICVAFESVSVAGERRGGGASRREALLWARGVRASFGFIAGLGYPVYPNAKRRIAGSPIGGVAVALWFMSRIRSFRELLATGEAECCALVDALLAAAPLCSSPVRLSDIQAMRPS